MKRGPQDLESALKKAFRGNYDDLQENLTGKTELDLSREPGERMLKAEEIKHIFRALQVTNVDTLNLAGNRIGKEGAKIIEKELRISKVTSINFSDMDLRDEGAKILAEALPFDTKSINFAGNIIGHEGAKAIAKEIRVRPVTTLNLSRNWMGSKIKCIAKNFPPTLTTLDLSENYIDDEDVKSIILALPGTMDSVNLSNNPFVTGVNFGLIRVDIKNLNLSRNAIGVPGAKSIAEAFQVNSSLISLDLSQNVIGDEGAKYITLALPKTVADLNLANNNISNKGVRAIFWYLPAAVTTLNLNDNKIYDNSALFIAAALERTRLTTLNICSNPMTGKGSGILKKALPFTSVVQGDIISIDSEEDRRRYGYWEYRPIPSAPIKPSVSGGNIENDNNDIFEMRYYFGYNTLAPEAPIKSKTDTAIVSNKVQRKLDVALSSTDQSTDYEKQFKAMLDEFLQQNPNLAIPLQDDIVPLPFPLNQEQTSADAENDEALSNEDVEVTSEEENEKDTIKNIVNKFK